MKTFNYASTSSIKDNLTFLLVGAALDYFPNRASLRDSHRCQTDSRADTDNYHSDYCRIVYALHSLP